ncbi:MAG: universal stress protein [Reichenbachiella sp.]
MKKILVPFDFSEYAVAALDFAVDFSKAVNGEVNILHVIEYPLATTFHITGEISVTDQMDQVFTLELIKNAKERIKTIILKPEYSGTNITSDIMMGNAYDGISSEIKKNNPDLIIMGTKGATGLKEFFVGSNAEKVVRNAHCPVLTVHESQEIKSLKNIVFPTSLDLDQAPILKLFKAYQEFFNAKIHLLYIETPHNIIAESLAEDALHRMAEEQGLKNYEVHIHKDFQTEDGILNFSWKIKADMIALCTHGYKGLMHLFMGSIAEDVVNHSVIPVWTMNIKGLKK